MQIEHKTEKGTVRFQLLPDNVIDIDLIYTPKGLELRGITKDGGWWYSNEIPIDFVKIGLTSEITEEQASRLGLTPAIAPKYGNRYEYVTALQLFKSLMQHLQVYEVNPVLNPEESKLYRCRDCADGDMVHCDNLKGNYCDPTMHKEKWQEAQSRTGKWIVFFKK